MKKSSLVAVILLAVASFGITAIFSSRVSINGFLLSVYSTASGNQQIQKVDAQTAGNGTVTINVQICQSIGSGGSCVSPRDPSSAELSQFSYDIQRLVGQGPNTQISTALSGIGPGQYSLPANTPNAGNNNRDNYSVSFKGAPTNYDYFSGSGFTDLYAFSISAGQNTEVDIPYTIYQNIEQLGSAGTTIKADIVDGNGNFVRALTDPETQSTGFDIQSSSLTRYGGSVGSLDGNFNTVVSSGKLNTSYDLQSNVHGYNTQILTNIKPPSGYVVRSIDPGTYFNPDAGVSNTVTIHFTKSPSPSLTQSADNMLYVPNGISYVKKIAQTYSDTEYKYVNTDVDLFDYHGNNNRPFPLNWSISKYSGVPYLFMDAVGKIVVYNISDPANPKQINEFLLSKIQNFNEITHHTGAGDEVYGPCSPENLGTHAFITSASNIFTLDDSPYILVDVGYDYAVKGTAVFSLDPSTMQIAAYPQWTNCGRNPSAYGMYKGSNGSTYFVSTFIDGDGIGIYTINSAGAITHSAILSKSTGMSVSGSASDLNYDLTSIFQSGNKAYLIGPGAGSAILPVYIYDISDPKNISKISQDITTTGKIIIDKQAKRMYVPSSIPNPAATSTSYTILKTLPTLQVYDLSVLPNAPKLIATYNKAIDLLNSTQVNADFAEINKRLGISLSGNSVDMSNSSFGSIYGFSPSVKLINVSNNLAYVSLSTSGKTPWDTIANQAGKTDLSEYGTNAIQFIVDLTNAAQPKILGMILGHNQYPFAASSWDGWFDNPLSGSIFDYNGYIYRANYRIADVWKLGNPPAQSTGGGTGASGNGTTGGGAAPSSVQSPFSFSSLLRIFQRVFNNQ